MTRVYNDFPRDNNFQKKRGSVPHFLASRKMCQWAIQKGKEMAVGKMEELTYNSKG